MVSEGSKSDKQGLKQMGDKIVKGAALSKGGPK